MLACPTRMDRREFIRNCTMGAAALAAGDLGSHAMDSPESARKNWVWITLNPDRSVDEWKGLFATTRANGVRAILPEIYDGRHAYFPSRHLPVKTDLLGRILPLARAADLEVAGQDLPREEEDRHHLAQ